LIAEGSDWFWWYGDDHSSEHDLAFDDLFRRHVRNVYRALERPIPEELFVSNITTAPPGVAIERPSGFIAPSIDGEVTSYFEWVGAGCAEVAATAGAMHQVAEPAPGIALVEFGFDLEHLFVRIDARVPARDLLQPGVGLSLNFVSPAGLRVELQCAATGGPLDVRLVERIRMATAEPSVRDCPGLAAAAREVVEVRVPFRCLGVATHAPVAFFVGLQREGVEVEHHPRHRPIELEVPDRGFAALNWTA
ncbi:MAG: hypothetical protein HY657_17595, partial [Acidobacteria bacterium]|nr:hypothetical protein [Acidobacteriota bacterium]